MVFGSVHSLMFVAWHFETASTPRKREKHFGTFFVHVCLMVLELASLEKKKKKKKKKENDNFRFFQNSFSWLVQLSGHICTQESQDFPFISILLT